MEIKRWKASSDDTAPSADIPPVIVTTTAAQSASVWSDSPMAPQPPKSSWNDNSPSNVSVSNQNSSVTSPVWDNNNVNNSSKSTAPSSFGWGASDNGWNGPSKLVKIKNRIVKRPRFNFFGPVFVSERNQSPKCR